MADYNNAIHCMLVPLQDYFMLLPNSSIVEVIPMPQFSTDTTSPDYWLGHCHWQNNELNIIDVEGLITHHPTRLEQANKLCILKGVNAETKLNVYGVPCYGSPQLITINESAIKLAEDISNTDYIYSQIKIGNKVAFIPHLDNIEIALS
jgi:chemosensory pili system protein ChpC